MDFYPNEPSVKDISVGSEASPKRDLGARPVNFSPTVRHVWKLARIFISLEHLIGSTTQTIMNFMPQDRLSPNALCVLEGRNQICTYQYSYWYQYEYWYHPTPPPPHAGAFRRQGRGGAWGGGGRSIFIVISIWILILITSLIRISRIMLLVF